jgi:imidazolonepropionase-like amidohydrolase
MRDLLIASSVWFIFSFPFQATADAPQESAKIAKPVNGRLKGMHDALADVENGVLKLRGFTRPESPVSSEYVRLLKKEYGVVVERLPKKAEDAPKDEQAELQGYNDLTRAEIEHRFGDGALAKLQLRAISDDPTPRAGAGSAKRIKPTAEHLFFKCKLLINPSTKDTVADAVIETNGGKIFFVGKASDHSIPDGAKVIDLSDKFIIPGLIDTHGHLYTRTHFKSKWQRTNAQLPVFYLANGVTTIGDPGSWEADADIALRNRIDAGELAGPRYFLAGEYIDLPPSSGWMHPVKTPEEARSKVHLWASRGATAIKIYSSAEGEVMQAAIDEAHEHSMRVWAHVGAVTFQQGIDMGIDQLFHGAPIMPDTRRPGLRLTGSKDYLEWTKSTEALDLARPEIQKMFRTAAQRKVVLTPTAAISELAEPGAYDKHHMAEQKRFYAPEAWHEIENILKGPPPPWITTEVMMMEVKKNKEFIRRAYDAGCLLSTGTDYVVLTMLPGWSLWREMEILSEAGLPAMEVLKSATWNGAYAIGRTDQLGSVEANKLADFVVLDANPLENISNVRKVHRVIKGGVIYDREDLLKPLVGKVD